jgi:hypothetical protein
MVRGVAKREAQDERHEGDALGDESKSASTMPILGIVTTSFNN